MSTVTLIPECKLALLVVFVAHANDRLYLKTSEKNLKLHEQLSTIFDAHMIQTTNNGPYQLNVDDALADRGTGKQPTPVVRKRRTTEQYVFNDSMINRSSILDQSYTSPTPVANRVDPTRALKAEINKLAYEQDDLQQRCDSLEKSNEELKEEIRVMKEKLLQKSDYQEIKDERNKLIEDLHICELEKKKLHDVADNVTELQQRIRHYKKAEEQMNEKTTLLEKKLKAREQQCEEFDKLIKNQSASILSLTTANDQVQLLERDNSRLKTMINEMENNYPRQIRILEDEKKRLEKLLQEPQSTEEPLIVDEKRQLEKDLHYLQMNWCDPKEKDEEIQSYKNIIEKLEDLITQIRLECQEARTQTCDLMEEQTRVRDEFHAQLKRYELKLDELSKDNNTIRDQNSKMDSECSRLRSELLLLKKKIQEQDIELNNKIVSNAELNVKLDELMNKQQQLASTSNVTTEQLQKIHSLKYELDIIKVERDQTNSKLFDLQIKYDQLTRTIHTYEMKLNEQEENEAKLKLQAQNIRKAHETALNEKQTELDHLKQSITELEQKYEQSEKNLILKSKEMDNLKKTLVAKVDDIRRLGKYGEDLLEHYNNEKMKFKKTEEEMEIVKREHLKLSNEHQQLQQECTRCQRRCAQLEEERSPLIAQLDFADRELRQYKKQFTESINNDENRKTSTTVHEHRQKHQTFSSGNNYQPLMTVENTSLHKTHHQARLIRSPSLDMRTIKHSHGNEKLATMDETRSLEDNDFLSLPKSQSLNSFAPNTRVPVESMTAKYDIENEDEPIHLDIGPIGLKRIRELQQRNDAQPKHLRTAYALETMDADPGLFSNSFIQQQPPQQHLSNSPKSSSRVKNLFRRK
ncbi:unnamed protein product [Didymodactylos carnosus]|uniref:Uncharacterized protein n=1 Tax=Didymodactylos carnosus TaxID=1234261 RepID=A0A813Y0S0_9BILA|nr:unnamed protein product [Didymodactylos carnosus]CAF0876154.1 unnamed protein product [Didymodactylos carnosus]CAF3535644.1 unnamed protein product [Didymodactylos carnosus]CAF3663005.1 unnamed protein product [Didymodactylos carnosus]